MHLALRHRYPNTFSQLGQMISPRRLGLAFFAASFLAGLSACDPDRSSPSNGTEPLIWDAGTWDNAEWA